MQIDQMAEEDFWVKVFLQTLEEESRDVLSSAGVADRALEEWKLRFSTRFKEGKQKQ